MREYGQYCPVALGSEVVSDRWTPLILREMILGSTRFNDIERGLPGISRSLLKQRLLHLVGKGVNRKTTLAGTATVTWTLKLAAGTLRFYSDRSPKTVRGSVVVR